MTCIVCKQDFDPVVRNKFVCLDCLNRALVKRELEQRLASMRKHVQGTEAEKTLVWCYERRLGHLMK